MCSGLLLKRKGQLLTLLQQTADLYNSETCSRLLEGLLLLLLLLQKAAGTCCTRCSWKQ